MDGHFVGNYTLGIDFVKALKTKTNIPLDIHLMVENPIVYINELLNYNITYITFHKEIDKEEGEEDNG